MGFALLAMVLWLTNPLITQIGPAGFQWTLVFFVIIATACWILGRVSVTMTPAQIWRHRGGAVTLVAVAGVIIFAFVCPLGETQAKVAAERAEIMALRAGGPADSDAWATRIPWRPWSPAAVEETVRVGKTVFVDFTAAYCTQCKANKAVATDTPEVRAKMKALGVIPFQADYTNGNPAIHQILKRFSRPGVPMNLIYPAGKPDDPILLNTVLTKQYLLDQLDIAGPSSEVASRF
jgi:thiol:disulfide interchange protein